MAAAGPAGSPASAASVRAVRGPVACGGAECRPRGGSGDGTDIAGSGAARRPPASSADPFSSAAWRHTQLLPGAARRDPLTFGRGRLPVGLRRRRCRWLGRRRRRLGRLRLRPQAVAPVLRLVGYRSLVLRLRLRRPAVGAAVAHLRQFGLGRVGFGRHVDDRAFLGAGVDVLVVFGVDPAAGDPAGGLGVAGPVAVGTYRGPLGFDRRDGVRGRRRRGSPGWPAAPSTRPAAPPPRRRPGHATRKPARGADAIPPSARIRGARKSRGPAAGRKPASNPAPWPDPYRSACGR